MRFGILALASLAALSVLGAFEDGEKRFVVGEPPAHTKGAYRPFVIPGEISEADGMVEFRKGRGITVWCPERVAREEPRKAAAAKRFIDSPFLPVGTLRVGYVGGPAGEAILKDLGVSYEAYGPRDVWKLEGAQVAVFGPGTEKPYAETKMEDALRKKLMSKTLVVLPGADLSKLPFAISRASAKAPAAAEAKVPDLPLFSGTAADYREFVSRMAGAELPVVEKGPAWTIAASPACFAFVKRGGQSVCIFNVAPADVPAAARPALTRVWCTMLANLNVGTSD